MKIYTIALATPRLDLDKLDKVLTNHIQQSSIVPDFGAPSDVLGFAALTKPSQRVTALLQALIVDLSAYLWPRYTQILRTCNKLCIYQPKI